MKPEIIFVNAEDGNVTMTKEQLSELLDKAYEAGRVDGCNSISIPYTPTPVWNPVQYKITCGGEVNP